MTGPRALSLLKPKLTAIGKKDFESLRVDIGAASIAALGVSKRSRSPALRSRFEKLASIGEFDLGDLELLELAALATQQARQDADKALAKGESPKVPLGVVKEAAEIEKRMQGACEHALTAIPEAHDELERLRPGISYRDLAGDLEGYADLYDRYPADVKLDGINYKDGDAKRARSLARAIYEALGDDLTNRDKASLETLTRAWTLLSETYDRVATVGRFLLRSENPNLAFPSLFVAGRKGVGRPSTKPAKGDAAAASPPSPMQPNIVA
jgi:hypothetical protein